MLTIQNPSQSIPHEFEQIKLVGNSSPSNPETEIAQTRFQGDEAEQIPQESFLENQLVTRLAFRGKSLKYKAKQKGLRVLLK